MIDFLRNLTKSNEEKQQEALNAYLDGSLSPRQRRQFEQELAQDNVLQTELEDLRRLKQQLRQLPRRPTPRNFTLDPALYGRPQKQPLFQFYPVLQGATVLTALFFILALGLELFIGTGGTPMSQPEVALEAISVTQEEDTAMDADESMTMAEATDLAATISETDAFDEEAEEMEEAETAAEAMADEEPMDEAEMAAEEMAEEAMAEAAAVEGESGEETADTMPGTNESESGTAAMPPLNPQATASPPPVNTSTPTASPTLEPTMPTASSSAGDDTTAPATPSPAATPTVSILPHDPSPEPLPGERVFPPAVTDTQRTEVITPPQSVFTSIPTTTPTLQTEPVSSDFNRLRLAQWILGGLLALFAGVTFFVRRRL